MNVLLTGGAGYIGSHTAVALVEQGHRVVLLDNLCNSSADVLPRLQHITGHNLPLVVADVRDTAAVAEVLAKHTIDAVVHFAGLKAVGESVADPLRYYANNVQGSISLLQAMQTQSVDSLVFSSSATVYGTPQYLPYDEAHPTSAINPYGNTKLQVEDILRDLAHASPNWKIACLRYFNPVGAHPSGLIGESPSGTPNNLMPYVVQVAAGQRGHLNVFGNDYPTPDGTGLRDYIHVTDLAIGHVAALGFLQGNPGWHAFNLGTGTPTSVLELVHAFEAINGVAVPRHIAPRRAGDLASYYANPHKAQDLLGWRATRGLADMCASSWIWQKNQAGL